MFLALVGGIIASGFLLWTPDMDRDLLEKKYGQAPSENIFIEGMEIHYRDTGKKAAPALIFIHGFGSSLHTWDDWAIELEKDYRVIRFDLPGFGLTGPDPRSDYSDNRSNAIILALMERLEVPKATVIGNSIGGRIAWYFAANYPQKVHQLVLISPDGFASYGFEYDQAPQVPVVAELLQWSLPLFVLKKNLEPAFANKNNLSLTLLERYYELMLLPGNRRAMIERLRQTVLQDPAPFLSKIEAPTLLLWGAQDALIPVKNADDYMRLIPKVQLQALPNIGHIPQEEGADRNLLYLQNFLKNPSE